MKDETAAPCHPPPSLIFCFVRPVLPAPEAFE
jgi:hypothetical protein